ncbi:protein-histidine N-methyltransferase SCDLUD_002784 [Saccharomycodes ludwigii]|uniref:protein-histidine N-methyltransferase n=1 Tax=Saccharomycodes ludwigii TaxID=36035 RepID=UPI001E867DD1|nr:hypothetical protein SCDLUD_002784 [Saccharomycodes ludwigii]KAH3901293.1 hypothetical protein SCDLUD_002784 [Saccharomycodes ludwigii]
MSFSFEFNEDDLNSNEITKNKDLNKNKYLASNNNNQHFTNPLDVPLEPATKKPILHDLQHVLQSLINVRITFEIIHTPKNQIELYRRELFDIKHQIMMEIDDTNDNKELEILMGETNEDLVKNVYEGGLKSWECSIDLVDYLANNSSEITDYKKLIELGCGTALPTEYLFIKHLNLLKKQKDNNHNNSNLSFYLCDYNYEVLRLATVPNLIISWCMLYLSTEELSNLQKFEDATIPIAKDEIFLSKQLLSSFNDFIVNRQVSLKLISGSWCRAFNDLIINDLENELSNDNTTNDCMVLTSETIYQPDTLPLISETLLDLKQKLQKQNNKIEILLAAKDIYFGVGGSILEFQKYIEDRISNDENGLSSCVSSFEVFKCNENFKRSIVAIK